MRSENEIRRQVETRLRRWALLALDGILWVGAAKLIAGISQIGGFGMFTGMVALIMVAWAALFGFHALRVFYVELREWLVKRAISRERRSYPAQDFYEKPKRGESTSLNGDGSRLALSDDGELIDLPFHDDDDLEIKAKHE